MRAVIIIYGVFYELMKQQRQKKSNTEMQIRKGRFVVTLTTP